MLFTLPRVFKKNSGAENLLLRVHERYSDLSGAEDLVEAENCDNNVHPRQGDKELDSPEVL